MDERCGPVRLAWRRRMDARKGLTFHDGPAEDDGLTPHDWLTQRAAAQILHEDLGIHPETARRLLVAGLIGRPRVTSLASFYRRDSVDAFVEAQRARPPAPWDRAGRSAG